MKNWNTSCSSVLIVKPTQMQNSRVLSTPDILYDRVRGDNDDFIDETLFRIKLDELVDIGFIETSVCDDQTYYSAKPGLKYSDFVHIDDSVKQEALLSLVDNPTTFFILLNTQKGKMRKVALEIKQWASDKTKKVVAFLGVDNDKTLADQSVDGLEKNIAIDQPVKIFTLSSNSKTSYDTIKTYIDAYAAEIVEDGVEPEYPMPVIALLANPKQNEKMLRLLYHIHRKVTNNNSLLRYGIIFDEADKIYPSLREKSITVDGNRVSLRSYILESNVSLYRLGFVTATDGNLLDEDYPECANAYMYPVIIDPEDERHYRALHLHEAITHTTPYTSRHNNNSYAKQILDDNNDHFMTPITLSGGEVYYRKVIVNSNAKTEDMKQFAKFCNSIGMYSLVFNGYAGASVKVYNNGNVIKTHKTKGKKFNEVLFYIYKKHKLNDKPLVIIGRRKVDRGLGFHYCPRVNDEVCIEGDIGQLITNDREGLVWTDEILGRIDDKNTAVQKAGRLAGIIGNSPQYPGETHYWTDEYTEDLIRRHNTIVDTVNTMRGSSALQAVRHAEEMTPKKIVNHRTDINSFLVYNNEAIVIRVCDELGYQYRKTNPSTDGQNIGFCETSMNKEKTKVSLLAAINHVPGSWGSQKPDKDGEDITKRNQTYVKIKSGHMQGKFGVLINRISANMYRIVIDNEVIELERNLFSLITYRTYYPCYKDINDSNSLHFVIVIRPGTDSQKLENIKRNYKPIDIPQEGGL
jgi:hypothetical protein